MASLRGKLLIASPTLVDPNFRRSVVLIAEHTDEGAMGLVLNRQTETDADEVVAELAALVPPGDAVYAGGPVQTQAVVVLAEFDDPEQAAALVLDDLGFLPADADLEALTDQVRRARIFAGHAGWGPGQLDAELAGDSWLIAPASADDAFALDPDELWAEALERKGGAYARLARAPDDPSVN